MQGGRANVRWGELGVRDLISSWRSPIGSTAVRRARGRLLRGTLGRVRLLGEARALGGTR